jgi:amino acid transporter
MDLPNLISLNTICAVVTLISGIFLAVAVRSGVRWLETHTKNTETMWDDIILSAVGTPLQVTIVAVAVSLFLTFLGILPLNSPGLGCIWV